MPQKGQIKWGNLENLNQLIDIYFDYCKSSKEVPTIAGLCIGIGIGKDTFAYYANGRYQIRRSLRQSEAQRLLNMTPEEIEEKEEKEEDDLESGIMEKIEDMIVCDDGIHPLKLGVAEALKKAKLRIEHAIITEGFRAKNPAFAIFYAKAALGYTEQPPQMEITNNELRLEIKIVGNEPKQPIINVSGD